MPFLQTLRSLIKQEKPDLLLIGSNHSISAEDSYISDHLIKIAKTSTIPVLIIPELTRYQHVECALVPFNLNNLSCLNKIQQLDKLEEWPRPKLLFLNADNNPESIIKEDITCKAAAQITESLRDYNYQFFYSAEKDVLKSVNHFSYEHELQLIIALPGKHSFLYNLTHRNITKGLARNNYKPVLILKNQN